MINKITSFSAAAPKKNLNEKKQDTKQYVNGFKENFVKDVKKSLPIGIAFAAIWTLLDIRKAPKEIMSKVASLQLVNNLSCFVPMALIVSGIDAIFKTKVQK